MRACITRHAEAVPRDSAESPRLLTDKGRKDAERLGHFLKNNGIGKARVMHNGRSWVQDNAETLAGVLAKGNGAVICTPSYSLNAGADIEPFMADLNAATDDIVAALPDDVAHRAATGLITGRQTPYAVSMSNGDAVCLERGDDGEWRIVWLVTTRQLQDLLG
jgi:phosphohistidine phosphatase SixA